MKLNQLETMNMVSDHHERFCTYVSISEQNVPESPSYTIALFDLIVHSYKKGNDFIISHR